MNINTKICNVCKKEKKIKDFSRNKKCKICHNKWQNEYYHKKNKTKHIKRVKENNRENKFMRQHKMMEYLTKHFCVDCGESDPVVLEFDHIEPETKKKGGVSRLMTTQSWISWSVIQEEIDKCEIRCANCHRRKTAKQFNHYRFLLSQ
tara:strand:- start:21398 stop:21841 length:444 start_codon:yes stop_codon:yes gene_type:complete